MSELTIPQRVAEWFNHITGLAAVTAVPVGRDNDGLHMRPAGTEIDKPWPELHQEFTDAREAWRQNPLARRLIGLITSHTIGSATTVHSDYKPLQRFIDDFWHQNKMDLRIIEWSDELARSGELFPVLFTNPVNGASKVRTIPACQIENIEYDADDYENEYRYKETTPPGEPEKWWTASAHTDSVDQPAMLHYAVNRPVGALRGESDLVSILPWLRRYSRWLEDRVRMNAAARAFLWIVHAPPRLRTQLEERYRRPPDPGSVIIAEKDTEEWEAVTPNLNANDVKSDGRAIRWMIAAGGPGTGLLDFGEGEDSNMATGTVMTQLRRRFLRRRQNYLCWLLTDLILIAYNRSSHTTQLRRRAVTATDIQVHAPDISPEDNTQLATAAQSMTTSLQQLATITGQSEPFARMALRLFAKFCAEALGEQEIDDIIELGSTFRTLPLREEPHDSTDPDTDTDLAAHATLHRTHKWLELRKPRPGGSRTNGTAPPTQSRRTDGTGI